MTTEEKEKYKEKLRVEIATKTTSYYFSIIFSTAVAFIFSEITNSNWFVITGFVLGGIFGFFLVWKDRKKKELLIKEYAKLCESSEDTLKLAKILDRKF